jgi:hypothetical protein
MTLFDILLIAVWVATSTTWGYMFGRRAGVRARPNTCSCGHGYGSHKDGRRCWAENRRAHYTRHGDRNGNEWARCPCLRHDGPLPSVVLEEMVRDWTTPKESGA